MKEDKFTVPANSTEAVTITIGRNISASPMPGYEWSRFKQDVRECLQRLGATLWVDSDGVGPWADGLEQNHVFVGPIDHRQIDDIRTTLATLGQRYQQICASLLVGHSELVAAAEEEASAKLRAAG